MVTVPLLPRYLSAPESTNRTPPPVGLLEGTVDVFAMNNTEPPPPNDVPLRPTFPSSKPDVSLFQCGSQNAEMIRHSLVKRQAAEGYSWTGCPLHGRFGEQLRLLRVNASSSLSVNLEEFCLANCPERSENGPEQPHKCASGALTLKQHHTSTKNRGAQPERLLQ